MSNMCRLDWWIAHLPLMFEDIQTEYPVRFIEHWGSIVGAPGGIQILSEFGNEYDHWLEINHLDPDGRSGEYLIFLAQQHTVAAEFHVEVIRAYRTMFSSLKKWRKPHDNGPDRRDLELAAERSYLDRIGNLSHCKMADGIRDVARRLLAKVFQDWDSVLIDCYPRLGPGAVAEGLNPLEKWQHLWKSYHGWYFTPLSGANDLEGYPRVWGESPYETLESARLCAVLKDTWAWRLITIESCVKAFNQQLCRSAMLECLAKCGDTRHLHLTDVRFEDGIPYDGQLSQQLRALHGSKGANGEGDILQQCTIDQKDASDWIGVLQVEDVFPANVYQALASCRSYYVVQKGFENLPVVQRSFAGMGNACTFVVQSIMFWVTLESLRRVTGLPGQIHVYGDDIICPSGMLHIADGFGLMKSLGWKINQKKSFFAVDGRFRESCGAQAYNGRDVTLVRFHGYDVNIIEECMGAARKIEQVEKHWPTLAAAMLDTCTDRIRNYAGAPKGTVDVDCPFLPRTVEKFQRTSRWNRSLCRLEYETWGLEPQVVTTRAADPGYLFASLLDVRLTRWRTIVRTDKSQDSHRSSRLARKKKIRVPYYARPVPKQVIAHHGWYPTSH